MDRPVRWGVVVGAGPGSGLASARVTVGDGLAVALVARVVTEVLAHGDIACLAHNAAAWGGPLLEAEPASLAA